MAGALTVATICWPVAGVLNPGGAETESVALPPLPVFDGSKAVSPAELLAENSTGLTVIVPTPESELVTGSSAVRPPRSGWLATNASVPGASRPRLSWIEVLGENVVVSMLEGAEMMNPAGARLMVDVPGA